MFRDILLDILFPKYCLGCGREGQYICKDCELYMIDINNFGNLISLWEYNGIIKEAIKRIKFGGEYDILKEIVNKKDFEIKSETVITFVPMHIKNQKKRGFNQAEAIANELGKKLNLPVAKLLNKTRQTQEQAQLSREDRLKNLKEAFCICAGPDPPQKESVLLVDDVYTTGATMQECGNVLRKAGYKNITYFTIARTV